MTFLALFVVSAALLAGCAHRPEFVQGEVTSVSADGDRLCLDTIENDPTHLVCGNRPQSDDAKLKVGDCYKARWGSRHEGRFTDVKYAGSCAGKPAPE
jgi:hypothetical protein